MDKWILKQLSAQIVCDLGPLIPEGYFERDKHKFILSTQLPSHDYLSNELHWGYKATELGRELTFDNYQIKQPRIVAAAEVLMNIGLLTASYAQQESCKYLSELAKKKKVYDGNSTVVYEQIKNKHIPIFEENIRGALIQYLKYLSPSEASPFLPLVTQEDDKIMMTTNEKNEAEKQLSDNTQYIININSPLEGNIQQGNENKITNTPSPDKILTPIVAGIISTVVGGILLYFLIEYIKNKP